jgi:hypothetical protein
MQKISSYLYPNRVNVIAGIEALPVRWNIVYQNRIKIYQGVDNVLTIDVKNAEQKRIDISDMNLEMCVTTTDQRLVALLPITPLETRGLGTVNITETHLTNVSPQFLNFSIYRINENQSKTVFYADTQFGVKGTIELLGSAVQTPVPSRYITSFLPLSKVFSDPPDTAYYSDAVEITNPSFIQSVLSDRLNFEFTMFNLNAKVVIEFTKDKIVSSATNWEEIETFLVTPSTVTLIKGFSYPVYTREFTWARVKYNKLNNSSGSIVKVMVTFDNIEEFLIDSNGPSGVIINTIDNGYPSDTPTTTIDAGEQ